VEVPREIVTRASSSGGRTYMISLSRQPSRSEADKLLLRTALQELETLDDALRQVEPARGGFDPSFVGLSEREATRACTRLRARDVECDVIVGS
ncbi:MAG: D-alanyl-D-alanine carboxypeptidase, partial [Jannaschia sp.]